MNSFECLEEVGGRSISASGSDCEGKEEGPLRGSWGLRSLASENRFPARGEGATRDSVRMRQRPVRGQEFREEFRALHHMSVDQMGHVRTNCGSHPAPLVKRRRRIYCSHYATFQARQRQSRVAASAWLSSRLCALYANRGMHATPKGMQVTSFASLQPRNFAMRSILRFSSVGWTVMW
jgi:hypothetical protein